MANKHTSKKSAQGIGTYRWIALAMAGLMVLGTVLGVVFYFI